MDPERVRAYLQVACAGLGFDIGEVWWTSNKNGSSTLMAIEEKREDGSTDESGDNGGVSEKSNRKRFVQLYTSKSYTDRRADLVNPEEDLKKQAPCTNDDLKKHVLSPRLVDAIAQTAQVVWANCEKREGLLGRSDMRLQTAVGMPVAVDAEGNMCVVVMFSPDNIESTDDAMEYLDFISRSATSSSIPCLLPVFDSKTMKPALENGPDGHVAEHPHYEDPSLGDGVVAHYVSLDDTEHHHDLKDAPKDCFGIPMLPSFAELDSFDNNNARGSESPHSEAFDEASFGVWSTIMNSDTDVVPQSLETGDAAVLELNKPMMPSHQQERLEEFATAFLAMSVFDVCDVWIPSGKKDGYDSLCHVTSVTSTDTNEALNEFKRASERANVQLWSGAVGRAYASGNPVWSANYGVIVDSGRAAAFDKAKIRAALAVPIFSAGASSPSCVVACYSLVRADPVPTVLRFVQQALRLLWTGLDKVEPHESVGRELWKDVAPADLGEMAADVEMQQAFMHKKRPHASISSSVRERTSSLAFQLKSLGLPDDEPIPSPTHKRGTSLTLQLQSLGLPDDETVSSPTHKKKAVDVDMNSSVSPRIPVETYNMVQSHLQEAVRAVGEAVPWTEHQHVATNDSGTKRAHVLAQAPAGAQQPTPAQAFPFHTSQPFPMQFGSQTSAPLPAAGFQAQAMNGTPILPTATMNGHSMGVPIAPSPPGLSAGAASYMTQMASAAAPGPPAMPEPVQSFAGPATATSTRVCRIEGCGEPVVARRPYCSRHSGNRLCEHSGCTKCAQGSTRFCIAHGGGRRCTFPGCDKGARDKFFCAAHGGGKRCSFEGCTKSAVGGSHRCTSHGGGRRCAVEGCDKSAQSSTKFCVKHGGGKKCSHPGCEKVARGRTKFCAGHGGGVRCKLEGCNRVAIGKLQLCRTHGGGSRPRAKAKPPPTPQGALFGGENPSAFQPGINGSFGGSMAV